MKKIYLFNIVCFFSLLIQAQLQEEDFNATTLPSGWTMDTSKSNCSWEFGYTANLPFINPNNPVQLTSGSVIFNDNKCGSFKNNILALESPKIDLQAQGVVNAAIELTYNHQAFVDSGNFMVDVWDGIDWQNVLMVTNDSPVKNSVDLATTSVIDISDYVNKDFKVRFVYDDENTRTFGVAIDHYKLINTNEELTEQILENDFVYFPNPVNSDLNLYAANGIDNITVFNSIGQLVMKKQPSTLAVKLPMNNLSAGVYVVQVEMDKRVENFKIFKK